MKNKFLYLCSNIFKFNIGRYRNLGKQHKGTQPKCHKHEIGLSSNN